MICSVSPEAEAELTDGAVYYAKEAPAPPARLLARSYVIYPYLVLHDILAEPST